MHTSVLESVHGATTHRKKNSTIYFNNRKNASKANFTKRTDVVAIKHYFHSQFSLREKHLEILDFH